MNTEDLRQRLRDYAREEILVNDDLFAIPTGRDSRDLRLLGQRGELAGKTFVALQNVLEVVGPGGNVDSTYWIHGRLVAEAIEKAFE